MAKKINNPNGKKGGNKHQILQKELLEKLENEVVYDGEGNLIIDTEVPVPIYKKEQQIRIADVAALVTKKVEKKMDLDWLRIIQIGKTDKEGKPVKREQEAIDDIEDATGINVEFYDYITKKKIK